MMRELVNNFSLNDSNVNFVLMKIGKITSHTTIQLKSFVNAKLYTNCS